MIAAEVRTKLRRIFWFSARASARVSSVLSSAQLSSARYPQMGSTVLLTFVPFDFSSPDFSLSLHFLIYLLQTHRPAYDSCPVNPMDPNQNQNHGYYQADFYYNLGDMPFTVPPSPPLPRAAAYYHRPAHMPPQLHQPPVQQYETIIDPHDNDVLMGVSSTVFIINM